MNENPPYGSEPWWKTARVQTNEQEDTIKKYVEDWGQVNCKCYGEKNAHKLPSDKVQKACELMQHPENYDRAYFKFLKIARISGLKEKEISLLVSDLLNYRIPEDCVSE